MGAGQQRTPSTGQAWWEATPEATAFVPEEATRKVCGVLVARLPGEKLGTPPADRPMVNVGSARMLPCPPHGQWGGGQARRRLMASGCGGAPVVVRGQESCLHGEGGQRVRSRGTGRPGGRRGIPAHRGRSSRGA